MNHSLQCPACACQIPVDLRLLAYGASFQCPNAACRASIGIEGSSRSTFAGVLARYENLEAVQAVQSRAVEGILTADRSSPRASAARNP
jgi:hypothetical protein